MKKFVVVASALAVPFAMSAAAPAYAGEKKPYVMVNEEVGVPVFPYDIKDRPYEVVGEVKAGVRKATVFSKSPDQKKIYGELWERAEKLGADAVINAKYGDAHMTAFSWGKSNATGTAIRFKAAPAVAPEAATAPAPEAPPAPAAEVPAQPAEGQAPGR